MSMSLIQYYREHLQLRNPVLIAALAGWNDAADSATTAIKFLIDRWKPVKIAEIDSEDFYVFTETRPIVRIVDGMQRSLVWPANQFSAHSLPEQERDIILYLGVEPQLKWRTFSECFLEVCRHFHVSEVILLGAMLADIPHSLAVPITGSSSTPELQERLRELDIHSSGYEGPTGMIGVLQDACRRANIPAASLWAAAPHYLAATPNIKVTAALLAYVNSLLSLDLDLNEIQADAVRFEEQITALVARDPEASAYVRRLEEQIHALADEEDEDDEDDLEDEEEPPVVETAHGPATDLDHPAGTGPLPSADVLIRSVEELLRREREQGPPTDTDDSKDEG
ncbi:PAC2 family protein [Thermogemmatispora aurantia]|jgi:proteasome assembly chaperone (PAC2) family protein|nr:PAC2 family protein [Thermogemmatispora aurantia]